MYGSDIPRGTCPSARTGGVLGVNYYIGRASSFWSDRVRATGIGIGHGF